MFHTGAASVFDQAYRLRRSCHDGAWNDPPELVYRSRPAVPLTVHLARRLLPRYSASEGDIVNAAIAFSIRSVPYLALGSETGGAEIVGIGAQAPWNTATQQAIPGDQTVRHASIDRQTVPRTATSLNGSFTGFNIEGDLLNNACAYDAELADCYNAVIAADFPNDKWKRRKRKTHISVTLNQKHSRVSMGNGNKKERPTAPIVPSSDYDSRPFRFRRLANVIPGASAGSRVLEMRIVDNNTIFNETNWLAMRSNKGFHCSALTTTVAERDEIGCFPRIAVTPVLDFAFETADDYITTMFTSTWRPGMLGLMDRGKTLRLWNIQRMRAQCRAVDLFKSTAGHSGVGEAFSITYPCPAVDPINCASFTDQPDQILLGGAGIYVVDVRMRSTGLIFPDRANPTIHRSHEIVRHDLRLPTAERITALRASPKSPYLFAAVSATRCGLLLWDMRFPGAVIEEIPLPLLSLGRHLYRDISWCNLDTEFGDIDLITTFSWSSGTVTSTPIRFPKDAVSGKKLICRDHGIPRASERPPEQPTPPLPEAFFRNGNGKKSREVIKNEMLLCGPQDEDIADSLSDIFDDRSLQTDELKPVNMIDVLPTVPTLHQQNSNTAAGAVAGTMSQRTTNVRGTANLVGEYVVNPFRLFLPVKHRVMKCALPFSGEKASLRAIIYPQISFPLGSPSLESEQRYWAPNSRVLRRSKDYSDWSLDYPLAETPFARLFTKLAGVVPLQLVIPMDHQRTGHDNVNETSEKRVALEKQIVFLGWLGSNRLVLSSFSFVKAKRKRVFLDSKRSNAHSLSITDDIPLPTVTAQNSLESVLNHIAKLAAATHPPELKGPVPAFEPFSEMFQDTDIASPVSSSQKTGIFEAFAPTYFKRIEDAVPGEWRIFGSKKIGGEFTKAGIRTVHEWLKCNSDDFTFPRIPMSAEFNFARRRLETIPYWQFPDFDSAYFAAALLDMLVASPTTDSDHVGEQTKMVPILRPNIDNVVDTTLPLLHVASPSGSSCIKTLSELFSEASQTNLAGVLRKLKDQIASGERVLYFASVGGLDAVSSSLIPLPTSDNNIESVINVGNSLCVCGPHRSKIPFGLIASSTTPHAWSVIPYTSSSIHNDARELPLNRHRRSGYINHYPIRGPLDTRSFFPLSALNTVNLYGSTPILRVNQGGAETASFCAKKDCELADPKCCLYDHFVIAVSPSQMLLRPKIGDVIGNDNSIGKSIPEESGDLSNLIQRNENFETSENEGDNEASPDGVVVEIVEAQTHHEKPRSGRYAYKVGVLFTPELLAAMERDWNVHRLLLLKQGVDLPTIDNGGLIQVPLHERGAKFERSHPNVRRIPHHVNSLAFMPHLVSHWDAERLARKFEEEQQLTLDALSAQMTSTQNSQMLNFTNTLNFDNPIEGAEIDYD